MTGEILIWCLVAVPVIGAGVCLIIRSPKRVLTLVAQIVLADAAIGIMAAAKVFSAGPIESAAGWFFLDALGAFHVVVMMVVFVSSSLYARVYFGGVIETTALSEGLGRRFGALWLGSLAAMSLALISNNLAIQWVAIEATTLLTAFMICIYLTPASLEAMWKYLVMCSVGVAFAFMGLLMLAASASRPHSDSSEALLWTRLVATAPGLNANLAKAAFIFLLVGYGTKIGLAPMHTWLPDAHSQAPSPVSALFSGFLLNAALYCLARYLPIVERATGHSGWSLRLLQLFGIASIVIAAAFIVFQHDLKRLLAYSSVEHLGIVALGLGLGGAGTFAALFHTLNHSLGKPAAFFAAGRLGQIRGTHEIPKLAGSLRQAPIWGAVLFTALIALVGAAPFGVFLSEFQIARAAADSGSLAILAVFLAALGIAFIGALRHAIGMAWGDVQQPEWDPDPTTVSEGLLAILPLGALLVLGVWMPPPLRTAIEQAAQALGGGT